MAQYYETTLLGTMAGQQIINRLTFTSNTDDPLLANASTLLEALGLPADVNDNPVTGSVLATFLNAQTTAYQLDEIVARNLFSVTDFITQPVASTEWQGTIAIASGDRVPTFVASKMRTNRVRTDIRRGTLALTGGTEEQIEGSDVWASSYMTLLNLFAAALNGPPSVTIGTDIVNFRPSVFGKERYAVPGSDPVRYAYRYYIDPTEFAENVALNVSWSGVNDVTSQTSRKIGRGS